MYQLRQYVFSFCILVTLKMLAATAKITNYYEHNFVENLFSQCNQIGHQPVSTRHTSWQLTEESQ